MILLLAFVFAAGLAVRRYVLLAAYAGVDPARVPFALESALQYRRVKIITDREQLPARDPMVSAPEGIEPAKDYTVFVDFLQAALARAMPGRELAEKLKWLEAGFFCLSIPLLVLWGRLATGRWSAGFISASLYAVAIAAVQRSTGAELSTENTAFPFLAAHLLARAWALRTPSSGLLPMFCSAAALALTVLSWDLMQFYLLLWAGLGAFNIIGRRWKPGETSFRLWLSEWAALVIVGVVSTYHRTHGLLISPPLALAGMTLAVVAFRDRTWRTAGRPLELRLVLPGLVIFALAALSLRGDYVSAYGHFGELVWAKLRFLNVKPEDPALLTFSQRLLWTPALHSPTIRLTVEIVGLLCATCFPAVWTLVRNPRGNLNVLQPLLGFIASILSYVLFFRFHVFVAFFGALLVGLWWARAAERELRFPLLARIWIGLCIFGELVHTLGGPWAIRFADRGRLEEMLAGRPPAALWGVRDGVYYEEQVALTDWLKNNAAPDTVLTGFGLSGPVAAYGKCGVVLHPKFETEAAREKVRLYAEKMFLGSLGDLRAWAESQGANWLVYGLGSFAAQEPTLQMRYMVNAMTPPPTVPARLFESGAKVGPYFRETYANRKYKVYRIMTVADEAAARVALGRAIAAFEQGRVDDAEREATTTLRLNPTLTRAEEILKHVEALRAKGFKAVND